MKSNMTLPSVSVLRCIEISESNIGDEMDAWIGSMIGLVVGGFIGHAANHFIGWFKENRQSSPERKFICAEIVFLLERYAVECAEVAQDEGEPIGMQGEYEPVASLPSPVDYTSVKGNWNSLNSQMMYEICSFPMLHNEANREIYNAWEYYATPPDYYRYYEERQYQYSMLGLKAVKVAASIRRGNKFPASELPEWPIQAMEEKYNKISLKR